MEHLKIPVTQKQLSLLKRIAKSDDRRFDDMLNLIFSCGLSIYFCERVMYISKEEEDFTKEELKQKALNNKLIKENKKFHTLSNKEQAKLGFKQVELGYSNYNRENDFIEKLAEEIKNNALQQIKQDYKEIEENTIKENIPGNLVKTFISPIDNCKFDYFISNNILSYRIEGTSNWQDFIPNNRDLSEKQNKEFNQLLEEVKKNA